VRLALEERASGLPVSNRVLVPGVLTWEEYQDRLLTWDKIRQCVGLEAQFYEGAEVLLFPPDWLNRAERMHEALRGRQRRARAVGIDPGEGVEETVWTAVDEFGVLDQVAKVTPNTVVIAGDTRAFAMEHGVPAHKVMTDVGGGGKQLEDRLKDEGFPITSVAFGVAPAPEMKRGIHQLGDRKEYRERQLAYVSMRVFMYHQLSLLLELDEGFNPIGSIEMDGKRLVHGFAIPKEMTELRKELAVFPKLYDKEGRMVLPPKDRPNANMTEDDGASRVKTIRQMIGHSPNRADSCVVAVHAMLRKPSRTTAQAVGM
jgi:hypothetical protein